MATDLVSVVKWETELNTPDAQGNTLKQSLEATAERAAALGWQRDERLDGVQFGSPERFHLYGAGLLHLYYSLTAGRQAGYQGVQPLSWSDMKAWIEMNEYELNPFEIETIKQMDVAYVNTVSHLMNERAKQ